MSFIFTALNFARLIGVRSIVGAAVGFVAGMLVMRLIAGIWLIPAAEAEARAGLKAKFAAEAARVTTEAARRSREIEDWAEDASDEEVRRLLRGPGR